MKTIKKMDLNKLIPNLDELITTIRTSAITKENETVRPNNKNVKPKQDKRLGA